MAGSMDNNLETYILNLLKTKEMRIRHVLSASNMESGASVVFSSSPAIAVSPGQVTVSDGQLVVNAQLDAASGTTAPETIIRRVLEFSDDGFATVIGCFYSSDVADADDATITGVPVPSGTILRVPANTGFVATLD